MERRVALRRLCSCFGYVNRPQLETKSGGHASGDWNLNSIQVTRTFPITFGDEGGADANPREAI